MGIRSSIEIAVALGLNNSLDDTIFERAKTELLDTMERATSTTLRLDAAAAGVQVPFGGITQARLIYIEAKGEINVRLDAADGDVIALKRMVDSASSQAPNLCAYALLTCQATALYLDNPSATDTVDVTIAMVGDLAS